MKTALAWTVAGLVVLTIAGTVVSRAQRGPAVFEYDEQEASPPLRESGLVISRSANGRPAAQWSSWMAMARSAATRSAAAHQAPRCGSAQSAERGRAGQRRLLHRGSAYGISVGEGVSRTWKKEGRLQNRRVPSFRSCRARCLMDLWFGGVRASVRMPTADTARRLPRPMVRSLKEISERERERRSASWPATRPRDEGRRRHRRRSCFRTASSSRRSSR